MKKEAFSLRTTPLPLKLLIMGDPSCSPRMKSLERWGYGGRKLLKKFPSPVVIITIFGELYGTFP